MKGICMSNNNFYRPSEMDYRQIVPAYQEAFAGEPWFEVSKCADREPVQRCTGGLSPVAIGEVCGTCSLRPSRTAYESSELIARFDGLAEDRPTQCYVVETEQGIALASVAW